MDYAVDVHFEYSIQRHLCMYFEIERVFHSFTIDHKNRGKSYSTCGWK